MSQYRRPNQPTQRTILIRRLIALGVVALVLWGVIAGVSAVFGFVGRLINPNGSSCSPTQLKIDAHVGTATGENKSNFTGSQVPYFWFTVQNTSSNDCSFNLGTSVTFSTVSSNSGTGPETYWKSSDCTGTTRSDYNIKVPAGQVLASPPSAWDKVRSPNPNGCAAGSGSVAVPAGGATYQLTFNVNNIVSENQVPFTLN
jgi:hypothetical protein